MKRLLAFFLLFAAPAQAQILSSVPYSFLNGTTANATQVNANFSAIVSGVNSGAATLTAFNALSATVTANQTALSGLYGFFNASTCPTGWIAADGTSSTVDLRGYFIRGWDNGAGHDSGRTLASLQTSANLSHSHGITDPGHSHTASDSGHTHSVPSVFYNGTSGFSPNGGGGANFGSVTTTTGYANITVNSHTTGITINTSGGSESRPTNVALIACMHQ